MSYVYRRPFQTAQHRVARVEWQPQPLWLFDGASETWILSEYEGLIGYYSGASATFDGIADSLILTENIGSVSTLSVDGAATVRRAPLRHPGWSRKQAADALARERAMERSIRVALNGEDELPPALKVQKPPQRTAAQMAAEMASAQTARAARARAVELGAEAQRARIEIERLQPELMRRRQQASFRVIEQLLGNL